jgi:hypothetical protein
MRSYPQSEFSRATLTIKASIYRGIGIWTSYWWARARKRSPCRATATGASSRRSCLNTSGRFTGFDDKIISMNARGMSTRDIQAHLQEIYGVEASPGLVSEVTEVVMEDIRAWQSRPSCSG